MTLFRFALCAVALALLVTGALWLADHPGRVQLDWLAWRVTTSVPVLLGGLLLLAAILVILLRLVATLVRGPSRWMTLYRQKRRHQGYQALSDGLAAVAGGQVSQARKLAGRAEKLLKDPHLTRLLTAQAAQLTGQHDRLEEHFEALRQRPETALVGLRGLLERAVKRGDHDAALSLAREARALAPTDGALAEQMFTLQVTAGRWDDAQALVVDAGRRKAWSRERTLRHRALLRNEQSRDAETRDDLKQALDLAKQALSFDAGLTDAALRLARLQAAQALTRQAAATLERAWHERPLPALAAAYLSLYGGEAPLQQWRRLQKLAAMHPESPATHQALGEAALAAKLWGQARKHLTAAAPTASVLALLARLEIGEYKNHQAAQAWLATRPVADPGWRCGGCGQVTADWHLICSTCGAVDSLTWRDPTPPTTA